MDKSFNLYMFHFIASETEYKKFIKYYDKEIRDVLLMPQNERTIDYYIKMIQQRDTLLDLGIKRGYSCN